MKIFATLAIAAAIRLSTADPSATEIFDMCNFNGDKVLDASEVKGCMAKHNLSMRTQKSIGNKIIKFAFIPKRNWAAVAIGISNWTNGTVSAKEAANEMNTCNKDGNNALSYKEVKNCLKKNAKALGLNSKKRW
jgi:hypothetical protein